MALNPDSNLKSNLKFLTNISLKSLNFKSSHIISIIAAATASGLCLILSSFIYDKFLAGVFHSCIE